MAGEISDAALWAAAKAGELSAFGRLYRQQAPEVRAHVVAKYGAGAPADDIVNAAFLTLWRTRAELQPAERVATAVVGKVTDVVDDSGPAIIGQRLLAHSRGGIRSQAAQQRTSGPWPDPAEAALLYFGAGLPMDAVSTALLAGPSDVVAALRRYRRMPRPGSTHSEREHA